MWACFYNVHLYYLIAKRANLKLKTRSKTTPDALSKLVRTFLCPYRISRYQWRDSNPEPQYCELTSLPLCYCGSFEFVLRKHSGQIIENWNNLIARHLGLLLTTVFICPGLFLFVTVFSCYQLHFVIFNYFQLFSAVVGCSQLLSAVLNCFFCYF